MFGHDENEIRDQRISGGNKSEDCVVCDRLCFLYYSRIGMFFAIDRPPCKADFRFRRPWENRGRV